MIKSMTGYGRGICQNERRKILVEIRSLNSKFLELSVRMPRMLNPLEDSLRKLVKSRVHRGKLEITLQMEILAKDEIGLKYNEALADAYKDILNAVKGKYAPNVDDSTILTLIARFPDIINLQVDAVQNDEDIQHDLKLATNLALDELLAMRQKEGDVIIADISQKMRLVSAFIAKIQVRAPKVAEKYRGKLRVRIENALAGAAIDEIRFLNEVAFFCDKAAIDEEIVRAKSHVTQFHAVISEEPPVGRKLDFILQEILREANTMGSKANEAGITKYVVEIKNLLEMVREQVQNLE